MQRHREAAGPSQPTQTITHTPPAAAREVRAGTLRLRGHNSDSRRVQWTQSTVDNEHLGRKSSKICCIYHKPKKYDESSSESSSSDDDSQDTGDEHEAVDKAALKRKMQEKKSRRREQECCHHEASSSEEKIPEGSSRNAYEKGVK